MLNDKKTLIFFLNLKVNNSFLKHLFSIKNIFLKKKITF
jgi:hypothetical protein